MNPISSNGAAREAQLRAIAGDGGEGAESAAADLFAEFGGQAPQPPNDDDDEGLSALLSKSTIAAFNQKETPAGPARGGTDELATLAPLGCMVPCPSTPPDPGTAGAFTFPPPAPGAAVALDFETYYDSAYSVTKMGYWRYCHNPKFGAYLVGYAYGRADSRGGNRPDITHFGATDPRLFPWQTLNGARILAHNAEFDRAVFQALQESGVIPADVKPAEWVDTAGMVRYFQCPGDLAGSAGAVLGVELDKTPRENAKGESQASPEMARYCARDAESCLKLYQAAYPLWPDAERELSALTGKIGRRGIAVDPAAWQVLGTLTGDLETLDKGFPWSGNAPPTSTKALSDYCKLKNETPPPSTNADSPDFLEWAAAAGPQVREVVEKMQTRRRLNRRVSLLRQMFARTFPAPTGGGERLETHLMYCGAAPGRWSGGERGFNPQNMNKDTEFCDIRGFLVPGPGKVLAIIDLTQIEARILLWVAGDTETLDQIRGGLGVYEAHARATMGWTGGTLKTENPRLYQLAKARVLGLGYGCGPAKFVHVAKVLAGIDIDLKAASGTVRDFRRKNAPICNYWGKLETQIRAANGGTWSLALPSGRRIHYRNVQVFGDEKDPSKRPEIRCEQIKGESPNHVWGGFLAENAVQGMARDLFADRLLALEKAGFPAVLLVHDEYVLELDENGAADAMAQAREIIRQVPAWAEGLPVESEGTLGRRYTK